MNLLAVDTSGPVAGVAVLKDGEVAYEGAAVNRLTHSVNLMPMIEEALGRAGLDVSEIGLYAAVTGPGSFTGVRIGVSAVKGMAHGAGKPCVGVDALEALAAGACLTDALICPIQDARAGQVYGAAFLAGMPPVRVLPNMAEALPVYLDRALAVAGERRLCFRGRRGEHLSGRHRGAPGGAGRDRACPHALSASGQRGRTGLAQPGAERGLSCADAGVPSRAAGGARTRPPAGRQGMSAVCRRMTLADVPQVHAIEERTFATPWSYQSFVDEMTTNKCARYLVAEEDGRVIAYAGAWLIFEEGHITNIAVDEPYRGRGVGTEVTRALMQYAANMGVQYLTLEVRRSNLVAQKMYQSLGFLKLGLRKRYYEDNGEDAYLMVCQDMPPVDPDFTEDAG